MFYIVVFSLLTESFQKCILAHIAYCIQCSYNIVTVCPKVFFLLFIIIFNGSYQQQLKCQNIQNKQINPKQVPSLMRVHWLVVQHKRAGLNHILVHFKTQSVSFVNGAHVSDVMIETDAF